uniref:BTB domain-containing protein n=1 Tax=Fagus sylvatica TaxID=28930 RepID=A0A2N9GUY4_FAGSY
MRTFFPSESCKETQLNALNPQSWLQVERGKLSKHSPQSSSSSSSSSIESLIKVPEPPILQFFKPVDYVEVLAQIHEELESCPPEERSNLCLLQFQVFRGLGEVKLMRRSLRAAWQKASTVHEKLIFGAWLKYEKQGEDLIADLLGTCLKCAQEFGPIDVASQLPLNLNVNSHECVSMNRNQVLRNVSFRIGNEKIVCDRQKISGLSAPFNAMLNGCFTESLCEDIDLSENNISPSGMRAVKEFSMTGSLSEAPPNLLLELLVFANKFCCESLKDACDRKLASLVSSREDAVELMECALEENTPILAASCLARVGYIKGHKLWAYEKLSSVISNVTPLGWMHQERSLYCEGDKKWEDLEKATELDPTLTYPYMYRAASSMRKQNVQVALAEINRVLGFKLALECLELRFCFFLALENYQSALCDVQAILTLAPDYRMFEGRVAASQFRTLVHEHVDNWTTADCWMQLYDRWSSVDDIGSLSVIYQMLESDAAKGVLYFRQSLLLLRLNCPEAAMRSLQLARQHASSEHERLVYEGWILYDTGHCEEGLQKAEESIKIKRSFEAFFLKAYALADSSQDPSCSSTVVSLLEDALKCPSDRLRKGQALNNLGSVYVDCGKLDLAANCYINALNIRHTRAHQGLARVHFLRNDKTAAYEEMTKLIEKARNNASAYEKRSEYCDRELTKEDLEMVTQLDPLRVYPYRYRAAASIEFILWFWVGAVLMDSHKEEEAIAELSRAISFKADVHLLHLRAAFHEHVGDALGALRDCRAALSVDPNHPEMLELHSRVYSHEQPSQPCIQP